MSGAILAGMQTINCFLRKRLKKDQSTSKNSETPNRFFTLPREIRDQIYREVLCRRYLLLWSASRKSEGPKCSEQGPLFWFRGTHYHWLGWLWSLHRWMKKRPISWADSGLLVVSKAISREAIEIMYAESLFRAYTGETSERWFPLRPLPSQQTLDRIQNLEIETCVCETLNFTETENWFKAFDSRHTKRNFCRITLPCYYCLFWCEDHTPFFRACQTLVGFRRVIVTLELLYVNSEQERAFGERYTSMREEFQAALEPHLGPGRSYNVGRSLNLEFHPREHLEASQLALLDSEPRALVGKGKPSLAMPTL